MTTLAPRALAGFLLLAAAGCGAAAPRPADAGDAAGPVDVAGLEAALAAAGLERLGDDLTGFLVERASDSHRVTVPAGACATLAARAAAGIRDIDTRLFGPTGELLAEDVEPDAHPTIQACAGEAPLEAWLVVSAYAGNGSYRVLVWGGDRSTLDPARAVVGGNPGFAGAPGAGAKPASPAPWEGFAASLAERGYEAVGEPVRVAIPADGSPLRRPFPVEAGWCYAAAAFPVDGTAVRLRLETGWGEPRADSDPDDGFHALQICPDASATWSLVVEGAGGARVVIAVHRAAEADAGAVLWLGDPRSALADAGGFREAAAMALRAEGFGAPAAVDEGRLAPGGATSHRVSLSARRCTAFAVEPGAGLGAVDLAVRDAGGAALGESLPWAAGRAGGLVVACPGRDVDATVHLVARRGAGAYRLLRADGAVARVPAAGRGAKAALGAARLEARRSGAARVEAPEAVTVETGAVRHLRLDVREGACAEVALLAAEGAWDAALVEATEGGFAAAPLAAARGPRARLVGCRPPGAPALAVALAGAGGAAVSGLISVATKPAPR